MDEGSCPLILSTREYDGGSDPPVPTEIDFGVVKFTAAGTRKFRVSCVGKNAASAGYSLTVSYFYLEDMRQPASRPAAPTELIAIPIDRSVIQLKWKDNSNDETAFVIESRVGPD